jgi:hypothetical protein
MKDKGTPDSGKGEEDDDGSARGSKSVRGGMEIEERSELARRQCKMQREKKNEPQRAGLAEE